MALENFKKACEIMKERKEKDLIKTTAENLQRKPDEERRKIFNEIFGEKEKIKK